MSICRHYILKGVDVYEKKMRSASLIFVLIIFAMMNCTGCRQQEDVEQPRSEASLFAMNTYMTFTAFGENAQAALTDVKQMVQQSEGLWSVTDENSEIYRANHSNGQTIDISEETATILSFMLEMAEKTDGALEPTIYPVWTEWGFTTETKCIPSQEQFEKLLLNVGYERIQLDGNRLTVPNGMQLDLGAVGKGYTADLAEQILKAYGIESAVINLGGNVQVVGARPDGSDWRIGIRDPFGNGNLGILEISDAAVVTSGGYENFFEDAAGNVYWHILDASTGYPAKNGLLSVTVVSSEGKLSDALSTALFVMSQEAAEEYWRTNGGFEMLLVTEQNKIIMTEGLKDRFSLNEGRKETIRVAEE